MRRFTLLLLTLSFTVLGVAQNLQKAKDAHLMQEKIDLKENSILQKAGGDVFWSTTFDWGTGESETSWALPEGWSIVDYTDYGMPWMWRSPLDTLDGIWTNQGPSRSFETPEDGFICVPADEYNSRDGLITENIVDTYIMTGPIDCSNQSSVVVKYNQLFITCCERDPILTMEVTADDGVHWATYQSNFSLVNNRITDERFRNVEFNITDVAAGMSNVQLKFYWTGSDTYYWMIDDLRLAEAYENEVVLEDSWAEINMNYDDRQGHINYLPLTQMGMESESTLGGHIGEYEFSGAMLNNGMADQWNLQLQMTVLKNGEQIYQEESDPMELWALDRDTLTANELFLANDYGDYSIKFAAISENEEEVPENDTNEILFTVTDSLYHRADFSTESGSNTGGWEGGDEAGDMVGVWYDIVAPGEITSITAKIRSVDDDEFPEFQYVLLKDMGDDGYVEWILSDIFPADSTMENTWVTLNMEKDGETEYLEPGDYIACVRFWGDDGSDNGSNGMSIGWDKDNRADNYTFMYQFIDDEYWTTGTMNQIGIVFNEKEGPTEAAVTFNVDMNTHIATGEFNPGSDFVDVSGSFNGWASSDPLSDDDGDGIYTLSLDNLTIGEKLEYKYRINGSAETTELPDDDPRNYTVRYWNILDDVYNRGLTTGIEDIKSIEKFEVYPNPNIGQFTVNIESSRSTDVNIKLYNLQGKVVFTKSIQNIYQHKETISQELVKGLYFLSLETDSGVKTQKIIVK